MHLRNDSHTINIYIYRQRGQFDRLGGSLRSQLLVLTHGSYIIIKKHFKNEQRSRDAAAKKRANTSGVGKIINYCEDIYIP